MVDSACCCFGSSLICIFLRTAPPGGERRLLLLVVSVHLLHRIEYIMAPWTTRLVLLLFWCGAVLAFDCKDGHQGPPPVKPQRPLPNARPAPENRTFTSPELERQLKNLTSLKWKNAELRTLLWNCLPHTLVRYTATPWSHPALPATGCYMSSSCHFRSYFLFNT